MHFENEPLERIFKKLEDFASPNQLDNLKRPLSPRPIQAMYTRLIPKLSVLIVGEDFVPARTASRAAIPKKNFSSNIWIISTPRHPAHPLENKILLTLLDTPKKMKPPWNTFNKNILLSTSETVSPRSQAQEGCLNFASNSPPSTVSPFPNMSLFSC